MKLTLFVSIILGWCRDAKQGTTSVFSRRVIEGRRAQSESSSSISRIEDDEFEDGSELSGWEGGRDGRRLIYGCDGSGCWWEGKEKEER